MSNYLDSLKKTTNTTRTENNAQSNISTLDPVLDFFSRAGAMRGDVKGAVGLFAKAYAANPQLAARALFYMRDIRGGQGERDLFRECYRWLVGNDAYVAESLLQHIPEYGRWDEMLQVITPDTADYAVELIRRQLVADEVMAEQGKSISLLAKWLPSENTSSKATRGLARFLMSKLNLKPAQYRKKIVALRKHIGLLEEQMSDNKWGDIDFEKLPSQAHRKHTKAFRRHEEETGYEEYLASVEKGEKKIKTSTLYTYEVFDLVGSDPKAANAMWENLPDYTGGNNALVLADVSGSMHGRPMSISVSLALYFAERNKGAFNGYFMTFSERPQLVQVLGKTLEQRLRNISNAHWDMNTNLEAAFQSILDAAIARKAEQEEMPAVLYVISDMEFDQAVTADATIFEVAKQMFEDAGYRLPHVVFWNVDSRNDQVPATMFDDNVTLISGSSQSTFRYAVEGKSPLELMNDVLNSERYAPIKI